MWLRLSKTVREEKSRLLLDRIRELSTEFYDWTKKDWAICSHYDADGLASAGILIRFLSEFNSHFTCRIVDKLSNDIISEILELRSDVYVFLDLGSDRLDAIAKVSKKGKVFVIDHHQIPLGGENVKNVDFVNPELFGLDGGENGCTSILMSLIAYHAVKRKDPYYLKLGIVGATGDLQLKDKLSGINEVVVREALKEGILKKYKTFTFFKLVNSPIHKGICWNFDSYIPGLTGEESVVISLLTSADIKLRENNEWRKIKDLTEEEKMLIIEKIVEFISHRVGDINIKTSSFIETVYEFCDEENELLSTADNFSSVLNACGRMNREDLALAICIGVRSNSFLTKIGELLDNRRKTIRDSILKLKEREIRKGHTVIMDGKGIIEDRLTGSIATLISKSPLYRDNIILVMTESKQTEIKISVRAPKDFANRNLNLGTVMRDLSLCFGGTGGGHRLAAGANIPIRNYGYEGLKQKIIDEFVRRVEEIIGRS